MTTDYAVIQQEIGVWARRNFAGQNDPVAQLLGMGEEIGEAFHGKLKEQNGIRGTREQHISKIKDSIGDIMIFFLSYCNAINKDFQKLVNSIDPSQFIENKSLTTNYYLLTIAADFGKICRIQMDHGQFLNSDNRYSIELNEKIKWFYVSLFTFCTHMNWDLGEIVVEIWQDVAKRDWVKFPLNGVDK